MITAEQIAKQYDDASGVPGWTAELCADNRVELTPPPGYTIIETAAGARRLVKFDASNYSFRIGETSE